jgi:hypothetical protein
MKKKLKLQIEKLRVDRFETEPGSTRAQGTVHALNSQGVSEPWWECVHLPDSYSCELGEC